MLHIFNSDTDLLVSVTNNTNNSYDISDLLHLSPKLKVAFTLQSSVWGLPCPQQSDLHMCRGQLFSEILELFSLFFVPA